MSDEVEPVPEISHYPTGAVRYRGFLLDGASHGAWEFFRLDGSTMRTGSFAHGTQVGTWRTFDRSGRLVKETRFPEGDGGT
jgi:antitoxin component YwqK of YwqJK toxin-antitoxin module